MGGGGRDRVDIAEAGALGRHLSGEGGLGDLDLVAGVTREDRG